MRPRAGSRMAARTMRMRCRRRSRSRCSMFSSAATFSDMSGASSRIGTGCSTASSIIRSSSGNRKFGLLGAIEVAMPGERARRLGFEPQGRRIEQDDLRSGTRDGRDRAPPRRLPRAVAAPHHHGSGDRRARTQVAQRVRSGARRCALGGARGVCRGTIAQGRGCASEASREDKSRRRQIAEAVNVARRGRAERLEFISPHARARSFAVVILPSN